MVVVVVVVVVVTTAGGTSGPLGGRLLPLPLLLPALACLLANTWQRTRGSRDLSTWRKADDIIEWHNGSAAEGLKSE